MFENEHLTRQLDIIPVEVLDEPITIIGAGAIGSFVALTLAKMGFADITVFDDDKIEVENMNCQFYRFSDIGKYKADALFELIKDFTGVEITHHVERYEEGSFDGIVVSAVDNMEVRKNIWENHKHFALGTKMVIDPRMGSEFTLCYAMSPTSEKDVGSYEKTLYSDENAMQERCTAKSTMYTALHLSAHVCKVIKDLLTEHPYTRVLEWNIGKNAQVCWPSEKS